jgi:hypothetical protein
MTSINSLCVGIKGLIAKGDASEDRAQEYYARAGEKLAELKARRNEDAPGMTWERYVKDRCDLSRERADELIRIAEGRTNVEDVRAGTAARVQKHRAKAVLRNTENNDEESTPEPSSSEPFPLFQPGKGCDFNSTSQDEEPGEPYRVTRLRGYRASIEEAYRLAHENLMVVTNRAAWAELDPSEITDDVIADAQRVADAWAECVIKLYKLRGAKDHETQKQNTMGAALH